MNIANWLHATATAAPTAPALFDGHRCVADYQTFARRAAHLSQWLQAEFGLRAGDRIVLATRNSTTYLELLYAVLWFGGTAVPVNVKLHAREILWIADNAEARLLITDDDDALADYEMLPDGCAKLAVSRVVEMAAKAPDAPPPRPALAPSSALAWLFYTSGTTGRPKGVMLSHGNLVAMSLCYPVDVDVPSSADASLYAAPLSHGAGLYNFIHVRAGARHVVPEHGFDPKEILDLGESLGNLSFFAAPTMVRRLIAEAKATSRKGDGIRTIVYGGGPMYVADIEEALDVLGPKFVQIYGQGETPMTITALGRGVIANRSAPRWRARLASVGVAHSCVDVRVVDSAMNDAGPGTPGEIIVRGPTVMQGYWRNEEATASSIVDNWLHTGDIGFLDDDGYLTLTDRSKDVIISGGSNIYPREVEEVLLQFPGVAQAAVVGRPSREWGEDVVAFVVAEQGITLDPKVIDAYCREQFASFKKPKHYEICADLPKNAYGKVLKTELRAMLKRDV